MHYNFFYHTYLKIWVNFRWLIIFCHGFQFCVNISLDQRIQGFFVFFVLFFFQPVDLLFFSLNRGRHTTICQLRKLNSLICWFQSPSRKMQIFGTYSLNPYSYTVVHQLVLDQITLKNKFCLKFKIRSVFI